MFEKNKRATIKEVASVAGVSTQTVSLVINERPDVSSETRKRIQEAVKELSYQPSALARGLSSQCSYTLMEYCGRLQKLEILAWLALGVAKFDVSKQHCAESNRSSASGEQAFIQLLELFPNPPILSVTDNNFPRSPATRRIGCSNVVDMIRDRQGNQSVLAQSRFIKPALIVCENSEQA